MLHVTDVEYLGDYQLWLTFDNGVAGGVDLEPELQREMLAPLKDKDAFASVRVDQELRTIAWNNGADLAPEFLLKQLRRYVDTGKIVQAKIRDNLLYLTNIDGRVWCKRHSSLQHFAGVPTAEDEALWLATPDQLNEFEQTKIAILWPKLNVSISKEKRIWLYRFDLIPTEQENSEFSYWFQLNAEQYDLERELEDVRSILSNKKDPNHIHNLEHYLREEIRLLAEIGLVDAKLKAGWPGALSKGCTEEIHMGTTATTLQPETLPQKKPRKGGMKQGYTNPLTALIAVTYHALEKENGDVGRLPTPGEVLDDIKDRDEERIIQEITDDKTIFWCDPVTRKNRPPVTFKTLTNKVSKLRNTPTLPVLL